MSQTLIICETCRNPQCYCTCKNAPSSVQSTYLLALQIRNLIAAREFNTAMANRELQSGDDWLFDHHSYDRELATEIDALFGKANAEVTVDE
jgi:DTW domain-containing protein YfiP